MERIRKIIETLIGPWGGLSSLSRRKRYPLIRDILLIVTVFCLGGLSALMITKPYVPRGISRESISIGGTVVETGADRPDALLKLSRSRLQSIVSLTSGEFSHQVSLAKLGATVDLQTLGEILTAIGTEGTPSARYLEAEKGPDEAVSIPLPVTLGSHAAVEALTSLKDIIDQPPRDATFDFLEQRVIPEKSGLSLDVYETLARLDQAVIRGAPEVEMAVTKVPPAITAEKLKSIEVSSVLGFFETPYSRMKKDQDRTHNVMLGASRLNGQIIMPGETFSFNDQLGDRSEAKGFRYAPVIAGGVLVEGMGGGTCQVASTLYAASFFAGLVVEERQTHSRPSSYIKLGLDATVSYPDLDLKLTNPFEHPVAVHFVAEDGKLRAEILGKVRQYTVTLLRKVVKEHPYPTRIVDDPNLEVGKEVVTQNGIPGYTVRRYQVIEGDKVGYRFQTIDRYPPTSEYIHRGAAPKGADIDPRKRPKPDNHKPYRASNYLRVVQGPEGLWYEQTHD